MLIPKDIICKYPGDTNRCRAYVDVCACGRNFLWNEILCPTCGAHRTRCEKMRIGEFKTCGGHSGKESTAIVAAVADVVLPAVVRDEVDPNDRSFAKELSAARELVHRVFEDTSTEPSTGKPVVPTLTKMKVLKEFVGIASNLKKLEGGASLNVKMDDKTISAIREKMSMLVAAYNAAIDAYVKDQDVKDNIRAHVRRTLTVVGTKAPLRRAPPPSPSSRVVSRTLDEADVIDENEEEDPSNE